MSIKKYLLGVLVLVSFLASLYYLRSVFADWQADLDPPTTTFIPIPSGTGCNTVGTVTTCPNTTTVTIYLSCTDAISGCNSTYASKTSSTPPYPLYAQYPIPPNPVPTPLTVTIADGTSVNVNAYSIDNAGNSEQTSQKTQTIIFAYTVSGNVFADSNKDGIKNPGPNPAVESNYTGAITITVKKQSNGATVDTYTCIASCTGQYLLLLPADNYIISYDNIPSGYNIIEPPPGAIPPAFIVKVGPPCNNSSLGGSKNASCLGNNIINLNYGISQSVPWYHCIGGDCRDDNGVDNPLPSDGSPPVSCNNDPNYPSDYASIPGPSSGFSNDPGIIFSGSTDPEFGLGDPSSNGWIVGNTTYPETFTPIRTKVIRTSYDYYQTTAKQNGISTTDLTTLASCSDLLNCTLTGITNGVYTADSNVTLYGYTFTGNKNYVILVKGDLIIKGNILVDIGSTATFSVSGDIKIGPLVGSASTVSCNVTNHNGCHVEGFYSADKSFIIQEPSALRLNIAGAVVTNAGQNGGSIQNQRDIGAGNATCPTYTITERPDFVLNAPDFLKHQNFIWQEVAP